MLETHTAFLHVTPSTMHLTSCRRLMPVLCLLHQDLKATTKAQHLGAPLRPPPGPPLLSSYDEDEASKAGNCPAG